MSSGLKIFGLYDEHDEGQAPKFMEKLDSNVELAVDYDKTEMSLAWIEKISETIPYIENALNKPNRLLNNNEEILQIEKTKKVTVDSIKHLSKHTNLIQDIDENDNVIPMKILNVLKEESLATYENRFIYTLMLRINQYIRKKKEKLKDQSKQQYREDKTLQYKANTTIGKENIGINISINSSLNTSSGEANMEETNINSFKEIERIEKKMLELMNMQNYKLFEKARFLLISPPLKMTNALLKNPNLQCAVKLWNYLLESEEEKGERLKNSEVVKENKNLKEFIDESFFMDYLILNNYDKKIKNKNNDDKYIEIMIEDILDKTLSLNDNITEDQLKRIINKKYRIIKNKIVIRNNQIENTFKEAIGKYVSKISNVRI